jgi:ribosomal protein S18 acetylase RimI-like enzyme
MREALPEDGDAIVAIDHVAKLEPGRVQFIDRILHSAVCLVVEHEGRVVAYGALEYSFFEQGFISMVYVAESERRRGIGRALLAGLAARCATRKLFTSANQSNKPMQELLVSVGYLRSGIIENLDPSDPELVYFLDVGKGAI